MAMGGFNSQEDMVASFKAFLKREENSEIVAEHTRQEVDEWFKLDRQIRVADFDERFKALDKRTQAQLMPFMKYKCLHPVLLSFCNDRDGDFNKWAENGKVMGLLGTLKKQLDEGKVTEEEVLRRMRAILSDPTQEHHREYLLESRQKVRVTTEYLIQALNEQLELRAAGNKLYAARRFDEALEKYNKALTVMNFVEAGSSMEQTEVDNNKVICLLNIAAVGIEKKEFGSAISHCTQALQVQPHSVKSRLRRAKAYASRGDYKEARADLEKVLELDPGSWTAKEDLQRLGKVRQQSKGRDMQLYANMLQVSTSE